MEWFKEDERMSPEEAKKGAFGVLNLWLYCRKKELVSLRMAFRRRHNMARKIAASNISDQIVRSFLKCIEWLLLLSVHWTRHRIEKLSVHISEIMMAILELNADKPDSAIRLLRKNFPAEPNSSSADDLLGPPGMDGISIFYIRLLDGLGRVGKA